MTAERVTQAILGDETPSVDLATQIGKAVFKIDEIATQMAEVKGTDDARWNELNEARKAETATLTKLDEAHKAEIRETETEQAREFVREWKTKLGDTRAPSKAGYIGAGRSEVPGYGKGDFLYGVFAANHRDADVQKVGKGLLSDLHAKARLLDGDAAEYQGPQGIPTGQGIIRGDGKSTLGTTDATGGWIIPNAIVDEFITPATVDNIYRTICTVVPGVTAASVDIPFRSAARARAGIIAFGNTKTNIDLAYNGYTATMYTLAAIYDIGNQFLRQSRGAAEQDVLSELAAAFAQGEAYYVREGSGSSQPFGYTSALTNGPAAFRSTFSPSATTLAGSMATAIATAAGALAGRGVAGRSGQGLAAVLSATSYWTMLAQGTDSAGFFFNPSQGPTAINAPAGTLISPFGIPVYPDADADLEGTAAVIDNLVVGNWKKFKLYFGQSYRVDSSEEAGTRWDTNLTGFRGEEEMGFDARPAVYAGHFQMCTDIVP